MVIGLLLGGVAGLGTVLYALAIGPLTQLMLPAWIVDVPPTRRYSLIELASTAAWALAAVASIPSDA